MNQIKNSSDRNRAINILENAFYNVPGIMWMIKSTKNRRRDLRIFLSFCFDQTSEKEGAYLTSDKNGVVFFYELQKKPNKLLDFFRKLYLILMVIGVKTSIRIMKTRERVDQVRPKRGWYGWFLATEKETIGIRAAYEIRRDMFRMADETNEPIYVETTIERIKTLYSRIGFYEYAKIKHPYENLDIWFMKRDPHTYITEGMS